MKENLVLVGKSVLFVLGGVLVVAAAVELRVGGPSPAAFATLAAGAALLGPPLALAWRDAVRHARSPKR